MAITVDENSYISVEDADAYFADQLYSDDWMSGAGRDKEKALIMATRKIDCQPLRGVKADESQILEFPRALYSSSKTINPYYDPLKNSSVRDTPGWLVEPAVTEEVRQATCEEAIGILKGGKQAQKRAQLQAQKVESFSLGSLSESYATAGIQAGSRLISLEAQGFLAPYLNGGRHVV